MKSREKREESREKREEKRNEAKIEMGKDDISLLMKTKTKKPSGR